jgi:hypothetical protein
MVQHLLLAAAVAGHLETLLVRAVVVVVLAVAVVVPVEQVVHLMRVVAVVA